MKNQIIAEYRKAAQTGCEKYWNAKKKVDELKAKEDKYYKPRFQELMAEATLELSDAESEANTLIRVAHSKAAELIKSEYAPDGDKINDNTVKLLKSGIVLTSAEINNLLKNAANNTMRRIIADYAEQNGITYTGKVATEEEQLSQLDALDSMARSGLQRDYYYTDIIANSERFNTVASDSISDSYTED